VSAGDRRAAVFLDRDGVLNEVVLRDGQAVSPRSFAEFRLVEGLAEAGRRLDGAGYRLFVVTNQPDLARGKMAREELERMHRALRDALPQLEAIWVCDHDDHHRCDCRKPLPGGILRLAEAHRLDLGRSWLIGDSWKDIDAARAAGVKSVLIRRPYNEGVTGDAEAADLAAAVALLLSQTGVNMEYINAFFDEAKRIIDGIDRRVLDRMIDQLAALRSGGGRLFFLGSGGGAGHASHAVNDFRKICGIESYSPSDNVSELTARINDDGWDSCYVNWLRVSRLGPKDGLFVFSVGGGNEEKKVSMNIVNGLKLAKEVGAKVFGVVSRDGGYTGKVGDAVLIIPPWGSDVTAQTEAFQAVVWHMLVSHPRLKQNEMKWESVHKAR
jgi:D-sedoheptulose 7-phosphate isomerase